MKTVDNEQRIQMLTLKFLLLLTFFSAVLHRVIEGQTVGNNDQSSDQMQHLAGLINNVMQLPYKQQQLTRELVQTQTQVVEQKLSEKFDGLNEVISYLNQTVKQMNEKLDQQSQLVVHLNETLSQQQGSLTSLDQSVEQLEEKLHQQSENFNQALSQQQESLENVANSILQQLELAFLCSAIPWPAVENAKQSIKQTSTETIITYTCDAGHAFNSGGTTRSTTCDGTSWTPIDDNCIRKLCRPVLANVIGGVRNVYALTSTNNHLFVTRFNSPIEVYDATTFECIRNITLPNVGNHLYGLALCPAGDCLYVSDYINGRVHKLNLSLIPDSNTAVTTTSWSMEVGALPRGLSVNRQHNLLVVLEGGTAIAEYTPDGSLVRETADSNLLWQAVEHVVNDTFVVSRWRPVHGVSLMSVDGRVIHSYEDNTQESGPGRMYYPRSVAVDREGFVLVADRYNHRILVLNPTLSEARLLPLPTDATGQPLNEPYGLWLDESKGRLYVGEGGTPYRVLVYDNVFNVGTIFTS